MTGKYCPACNQTKRKALMVIETTATWFDVENYYVPDDSDPDVFRAYERCLRCGSILVDPSKKKKRDKKGKTNSRSSRSRKRWNKTNELMGIGKLDSRRVI